MAYLCLRCQGIELPKERLSLDHVAVRFGHVAGVAKVFLDGEDITNICTEAFQEQPGKEGWAIVFCTKERVKLLALCENRYEGHQDESLVAMEKKTGLVFIQWRN